MSIILRSWKYKALLTGAVTLICSFLSAALYPTIGTEAGALLVIALIAAAYLFDLRAVLAVLMIGLGLVTVLVSIQGYTIWNTQGSTTGLVRLVVVGVIAAQLRQMGRRLEHYLDERSAIRREMLRRNAELAALEAASLQLTESLELDPILQTIVETTINLVQAKDVQVFLYDGNELSFGAAFYDGKQQNKLYHPPRRDGATYRAAATNQTFFIADVDSHPIYQNWKWGGAIAILPLSKAQQVHGVMSVVYPQPHEFDETERRVLQLLASQAAIAIHNARSYEAVRQQASNLEQHVTDRTTELVESKERAETVLNNSFDAIVLLNPGYGIEQTNPAFHNLFGYKPEEIAQESLFKLIHPNFRERLIAILHEVIATEQPARVEALFQRQDGSSFVADVALAPIPGRLGADENQPNIACSIRDMTGRQRAEEQQQQMTSGLRTVLAVANELMSAPDLDTVLREAVEAMRNKLDVERCAIFLVKDGILWGTFGTDYTRQTTDEHAICFPLLGQWKNRIEGMRPDDPQWIIVEENQTNWDGEHNERIGQGWIAITPIQSADHLCGVMFNDTAISKSAVDETQQEIVSVFCSLLGRIIEHKQEEGRIRQALAKEVELGELKSRFISNISHEFRTPLAIIQSSTQLLKHYQDRMDTVKKAEHLDKVETQVGQMTILLENILMISRDETVGLACNRTHLDVITFCRTVTEEIEQASGRTHTIIFTSEGDFTNCELDEKLLRQIVTNLLTNAIKYSPLDSRVINFRLAGERNEVMIQVQDEGIGIPEEDLAHLFQDFHRGRNVGAISGTGLGLSIVKRAAHAHGGNVSVESQVGTGTTFTVRLLGYQPLTDMDIPEPTPS